MTLCNALNWQWRLRFLVARMTLRSESCLLIRASLLLYDHALILISSSFLLSPYHSFAISLFSVKVSTALIKMVSLHTREATHARLWMNWWLRMREKCARRVSSDTNGVEFWARVELSWVSRFKLSWRDCLDISRVCRCFGFAIWIQHELCMPFLVEKWKNRHVFLGEKKSRLALFVFCTPESLLKLPRPKTAYQKLCKT